METSATKAKKECVIDFLKHFEGGKNEKIIKIWNSICDNDDYIYTNSDDFLDKFFKRASDVVKAIYFGKYRYSDIYVRFDGKNNLQGFDFWDDEGSPIDIEIIADYIIENGDNDCPLDNECLEKAFTKYVIAKQTERGVAVYEIEIATLVSDYSGDFLMEDWDDIFEELFINKCYED